MNYRGSSKHLIKNAKSAPLAAIEIYNKPGFQYRDECFVILILNAWELALKALISKHKGSIYYKKSRKEPHRTLSLVDAFTKAKPSFPKKIDSLPVGANLRLLSTFRDNAVHFYNEDGFGVLIYSLGQTAIVNLRDLMKESFRIDIGDDISWQLMPLGLRPPIDPIEYITKSAAGKHKSSATKQFLATLMASVNEIEDTGTDTGRLMTVFKIALTSIKKIEKADVIVGVAGKTSASEDVGPLLVTKIRDPNIAYPLRQKEVVEKIGTLHGKSFTSNTFQALCHQYGFKSDPTYCWRAAEGVLTKYSNDIVQRISTFSPDEVQGALHSYKSHLKKRRTHAR